MSADRQTTEALRELCKAMHACTVSLVVHEQGNGLGFTWATGTIDGQVEAVARVQDLAYRHETVPDLLATLEDGKYTAAELWVRLMGEGTQRPAANRGSSDA